MGMTFNADSKVRRSEVRAIVTRANGQVEDHGQIAYYHKFPPFRWAWSLKRAIWPAPIVIIKPAPEKPHV